MSSKLNSKFGIEGLKYNKSNLIKYRENSDIIKLKSEFTELSLTCFH